MLNRILFALVAVVSGSLSAHGQCHDWSQAFGPTGYGFPNGESWGFTTYDDGTGPALYTGTYTTQGVVRWNGSGWTAVGGSFNSLVATLLPFDDGSGLKLYGGGYFTVAEGNTAQRIARWDGTSWTELGGGADSAVFAMCVFDDGAGPKLYVAGAFTHVGGVAANRIARWDGSTWSALGTGLNNTVNALVVHDDGSGPALYAGGEFNNAGGVTAIKLARWNGTSWSSLSASLGGGSSPSVRGLLSSGGTLYAAGSFEIPGQGVSAGVEAWNGTTWTNLSSMNGATTVATFDDGSGPALYAGGGFQAASGNSAIHCIAKWNGSVWEPLSTGVAGPFAEVKALATWDDGSGPRLFVGGRFTSAGGNPALSVCQWGVPCSLPVIVTQPVDVTAAIGDTPTFTISALGTATLTYQWRHNGVDLVDSQAIDGSTTPRLRVFYWSLNDAGNYDCVVTNPLGQTASNAAVFSVPVPGITGLPFSLTRIVQPPQSLAPPATDFCSWALDPTQSSTDDIQMYLQLNGTMQGNGTPALGTWSAGVLSSPMRTGDQAPGTPAGTLLTSTFGYSAGADATVLCSWKMSGPGVTQENDYGLWRVDSSGPQLLLREGDPAPGAPSLTVGNIGQRCFSRNANYVAMQSYTLSGTTYQYDSIVRWDGTSGWVLALRTGIPAPGTSGNITFLSSPSVYDSGDLLIVADLDTQLGYNYTGYHDNAIWIGPPGSLALVARTGDPAPGFPANTNLESIWGVLGNENGDIVFRAFVAGPANYLKRGLFRWSQGTLTKILSQDDVATNGPAGSLYIDSLPLALNNAGELLTSSAWNAGCSPPGCVQGGLELIDASNSVTPVVLRGLQLPGAAQGAEFYSAQAVTLNDLGQVVVQAEAFPTGNPPILLGWNSAVGLFPIAAPGTQFETSPGQYVTVSGASIGGQSGSTTTTKNLSNSGQVALYLAFTNFTSGIFIGQFLGFQAQFNTPGTPFCAGDGSLATPCPCANNGLPGHGCQNSVGTGGALLTSLGVASLSDDLLQFTSSGELPNAPSILLQGSATSVSGFVFGDGVRCVAGALKRMSVHAASGGVVHYPAGSDQPISVRSAALGNPISAASKRWYQVYYRDPSPSFCPNPPGNGWNVSNGQEVFWNP